MSRRLLLNKATTKICLPPHPKAATVATRRQKYYDTVPCLRSTVHTLTHTSYTRLQKCNRRNRRETLGNKTVQEDRSLTRKKWKGRRKGDGGEGVRERRSKEER
ncbi:unnamed protein product, partial [Tuber aestivum]